MSEEKLSVEAMLDTTIENAWNAYTLPEHIVNWNFASDDWCCPRAENDLKVGGKYNARMEAKDGSMGFDFEAIYEVVDEPNEIVYKMLDGREAIISFTEMGNSTHVNVSFDAENMNPRDMQEQGWQAILNNYKDYAESI